MLKLSTTAFNDASLCLLDQAAVRLKNNPYRWFFQWIAVNLDTGCWEWQGLTLTNGYGYTSIGPKRSQKKILAHRLAYRAFVGPIRSGMQIDHLCRVRNCVRPEHLDQVTHRENLIRGFGWAGLNTRKTHCPAGHEYTKENTYDMKLKNGNWGRQCRECHRLRENERYHRGLRRVTS